MDNLLNAVQDERKKYGATMTDNECAALCNAVAWKYRDVGWGVSGKTAGTRGKLPNGTEIAVDILHHRPTNTIVDVIVAAGDHSTPAWNVLGPQNNLGDRPWVAPADPAFGRSAPAPVVVAAPTPSEHDQILALLHSMTEDIAAIKALVATGTEASVSVEQRLSQGVSVRLKTLFGKIRGTVGGE